MESERPDKRQRTEEVEYPAQCSDIWFDDGNVILQAENIQFRVHRGLLARHSSVFKDMFSMPQATASTEESHAPGGPPIVYLSDAASDVQYALAKLFNLADPEDEKKAPTISQLVSALRIGHKYLIPRLWNDSVSRLRCAFPSNQVAFRECLYKRDDITRDNTATAIRVLPSETLLELVDTVAEVGLQTVLPPLYYRILLRESLNTLIDNPYPRDNRARAYLLGGRAELLCSLSHSVAQWLKLNAHGVVCTTPAECRKAGYVAYADIANIRFPIGPWINGLQTGMCAHCNEQLQSTLSVVEGMSWVDLPRVFRLPAWKDLKDFDIS
ncbi:hypothetical protein BD626DRAFT_397813 [Schizophyllum amplum]|uniref:BTB domain-containing protein n=1 Tax=Schizophyllum amplum TaxID=97359 RepID=A0A550CLT7_9AGAR|nr:hypothetical protein BD626DRAFT_397813 [Auriculariopsis ampla]